MSAVVWTRAALSEAAATDERVVSFVASTEAVDGHGTAIKQNWRLARYLATGAPVLYGHDQRELPIGSGENVRVENGQLLMDVRFVSDEINPMASRVLAAVKAGVVRGASVGFKPGKVYEEKRGDSKTVLMLDDNELVEVSITPTPSNSEALAQLRALATGNHQKVSTMDSILRALGVEGVDEAVARVAHLRGAAEIVTALETATGKRGAEIVGHVAGLQEQAERAAGLAKELADLKSEAVRREIESLIDGAIKAGKLPPAKKDKAETFAALGIDALRAFLDALEPVVATVTNDTRQEPAQRTAQADDLDDEDRKLARALGLSEDEYRRNRGEPAKR